MTSCRILLSVSNVCLERFGDRMDDEGASGDMKSQVILNFMNQFLCLTSISVLADPVIGINGPRSVSTLYLSISCQVFHSMLLLRGILILLRFKLMRSRDGRANKSSDITIM